MANSFGPICNSAKAGMKQQEEHALEGKYSTKYVPGGAGLSHTSTIHVQQHLYRARHLKKKKTHGPRMRQKRVHPSPLTPSLTFARKSCCFSFFRRSLLSPVLISCFFALSKPSSRPKKCSKVDPTKESQPAFHSHIY